MRHTTVRSDPIGSTGEVHPSLTSLPQPRLEQSPRGFFLAPQADLVECYSKLSGAPPGHSCAMPYAGARDEEIKTVGECSNNSAIRWLQSRSTLGKVTNETINRFGLTRTECLRLEEGLRARKGALLVHRGWLPRESVFPAGQAPSSTARLKRASPSGFTLCVKQASGRSIP